MVRCSGDNKNIYTMILLHLAIFITLVLSALSAPDLTQARAKINEAKARVLENRAKLRANFPKLSNHAEASRPKRQHGPEYAPPYQQPEYAPPVATNQYGYQAEEPTLVHICSSEEDGYARSAEHHGPTHFHENLHALLDGNVEHLHDVSRSASDEDADSAEHVEAMRSEFPEEGGSLDKALAELRDVKDILNKIDENNVRRAGAESVQRPNSKFFGNHQEVFAADHLDTDRAFAKQKSLDTPTIISSGRNDAGLKAADAHRHQTFHSHQHIHTHGTFPVNPGYIPQSQVIVPGVNLNINQNQGINAGLHSTPLSNQGLHITPYINQGFASLRPITQSQSVISTQTLIKGAEPEAHGGSAYAAHGLHTLPQVDFTKTVPSINLNHPISHQSHGVISNFPRARAQLDLPSFNLNRPFNRQSGGVNPILPQSHDELLDPHLASTNERDFEESGAENPVEAREARKHKPVYYVVYPPPPYYSYHPYYREADDDVASEEFPFEEKPKEAGESEDVAPFESRETEFSTGKKNKDNFRETEFDNDNIAAEAREADPHKKKYKKFYPQTVPIYVQPQSYGRYRDAEDASDNLEVIPAEAREADPHKKKYKKYYPQTVPIYVQPQSYGHYRDAEDSSDNLEVISAEARGADPHKKKYKKFYPQTVPIYVQPQNYGRYRDAEDDSDNLEVIPAEAREADPHKKKYKKFYPQTIYVQPQHYGTYKEAEDNSNAEQFDSREADSENTTPRTDQTENPQQRSSLDDIISSNNYIFNFPEGRRFTDQYKRSLDKQLDEVLRAERKLIDSLNATSEDNADLKFIADVGDRTLSSLEESRKKVSKRSIPLTRLITDPHVKLDVPKTIENFGTAAKNSFEDERAPLYHLQHLLGSSKNALLSAMRIPPQNMIIPSDYEIVRSERDPELLGASDSFDDDPISRTFQRVGQIMRESIRSGQETAAHIGDAAHSARNIITTAKHSAPRLITPYSKVPAVKDTRLMKSPSKTILITPRILDLAEEKLARKSADSRPNFVRLGHLMDAVGITKPEPKNLDLQKLIFEPRRITEGHVDKKLEQIYGRFRDTQDQNVATVKEALNTLENARLSVGAKNLKEFLLKMKNQLSDVADPPKEPKRKKVNLLKKKQAENKEMGKFIETLFDEAPKNDGPKNEVVGAGLLLPPELMRPFMGRPTEIEMRSFLRDNGDDNVKEHHVVKQQHNLNLNNQEDDNKNSDLGYVLGAINPLMFERMYNQTVKVHNNDASSPEDMFRRTVPETDSDVDGTVGTSMTMTQPLLTPFMGQATPEQVADLLDTYNAADGLELIPIED